MARPDGSGVGIVGLGVALPGQVRSNAWWREHHPESFAADDFVRGTERALEARGADWRGRDDPFRGAVERRVLEDERRPSDLEADACRAALASCGCGPDEVDLFVGFSQVQDDVGPANVNPVARRLGLPHAVTALGVDAGCASFVPHTALAVRMIQAGDHARALLYQSSAISRVTDYSKPASVLGGDGAVAEVIAPVEPGLGFVGRVQRHRARYCEGLVLARQDGDPRWYEAGSAMRVWSRDREAAHQMGVDAGEFARETCAAVLERNGAAVPDVDFFVCAQAAAWFGEACAQAVGMPGGRYLTTAEHFERYGHLMAGSLPLNLYVAWSTGRLRKGDLVLAYSPGVGFVQAAMLLRWAMDPPAGTWSSPRDVL